MGIEAPRPNTSEVVYEYSIPSFLITVGLQLAIPYFPSTPSFAPLDIPVNERVVMLERFVKPRRIIGWAGIFAHGDPALAGIPEETQRVIIAEGLDQEKTDIALILDIAERTRRLQVVDKAKNDLFLVKDSRPQPFPAIAA